MWETQTQFNVFFTVFIVPAIGAFAWFSDKTRRHKAMTSLRNTFKNMDYVSIKKKLVDFVEKYYTRPEMNTEEVHAKIADFRVAQQRYNEAAERARFALQSHKEQCEEACERAAQIKEKTDSAQASRSFQQFFMDAKPETVGTHVQSGCVLLAKNVLKVELWDLLNQGVKMGVAVTRPRRDEPFTVQGIVLYIQLKKYMQLVCLAVDAKFRKDNIEATLHEAFIKATKKNCGADIPFVICDLPASAPFKTFPTVLENLGYAVDTDKDMASLSISASKGKKAAVFDPSSARDSIRKWDLLIRPVTVAKKQKSKSKEKKSSTGQLPKKALGMKVASPAPEASIPTPSKAEEKTEKTVAVEKKKPEEPPAKKQEDAPVVEKKVEEKVTKVPPAKVEEAVKETPTPQEVPKVAEEQKQPAKVAKEEPKEKEAPAAKTTPREPTAAPKKTEAKSSPVKDKKEPKKKQPEKKANPAVNGTGPIANGVQEEKKMNGTMNGTAKKNGKMNGAPKPDEKILKETSTTSTTDGAPEEVPKQKMGWKPSLKGSMGNAAARLAALK